MIVRPREYLVADEPVPGKLLWGCTSEWLRGKKRLEQLRRAYDNDRAICYRQRKAGMPNNRLAHGYARYIATMASGYLLGKPVSYAADDEYEQALEELKAAYKETEIDSVDMELARDAAIYGKAVEITYADENAKARTAALNPENAFVVYDDTAENKPLFGVYMLERKKEDGAKDGYAVTVYTAEMAYEYRVGNLNTLSTKMPEMATEHYFGGVPMVEVWNDDNEHGDFEQVQSLIDAYDTLESDRVNDKEQFVDALLVLTGTTMERDEDGRTPAQQIREDKILALVNSDSNAEYLSRSLPESDVEVLKDALKADIHKFSMVPDLTDENFAGNTSGVAMRYKLLGLEQLVRVKERWFKQALKERAALYANFLFTKGAPYLDTSALSMTFTRSLPINETEIAQMVSTLHGIVPDELLLGQLPFVDDVQTAMEQMRGQKQESLKMEAEMFGKEQQTARKEEEDEDEEGAEE